MAEKLNKFQTNCVNRIRSEMWSVNSRLVCAWHIVECVYLRTQISTLKVWLMNRMTCLGEETFYNIIKIFSKFQIRTKWKVSTSNFESLQTLSVRNRQEFKEVRNEFWNKKGLLSQITANLMNPGRGSRITIQIGGKISENLTGVMRYN